MASLENNENADLGPTGIYPLVRFAGCKGTIDRLITPDKFRFKEKARATGGSDRASQPRDSQRACDGETDVHVANCFVQDLLCLNH